MGTFVSGDGLNFPTALTFGPDGNLYVASEDSDEILRFKGTTGQPMGDFTTGGTWAGSESILFVSVPEPSSLALLAILNIGLIIRRRKVSHPFSRDIA
jgi:hypothetical protein